MNKSMQLLSRGVPRLIRGITTIVIASTCISQLTCAQDYVEPAASEPNPVLARPRGKVKSSYGYGPILSGCSLFHKKSMPVFPPVNTPGYGYHPTCWRQISQDSSCACETLTFTGQSEEQLHVRPPIISPSE